ncbi:MAG: hypothetical protein N2C14_32675 [Planctomycetales bacterium]
MKQKLDERETDFLVAAAALVAVQESLFAKLETLLGKSACDHWIRRSGDGGKRRDEEFSDDAWSYAFHGFEVDATHREDDRRVRMELGPRGMTNVFSEWSVGVFVVSSQPPWPVFPRLRNWLADRPRWPNFARATELRDSLMDKGLFAFCAADLVQLKNQYTRKSPSGGGEIMDVPPDLQPETPEDLFLCNRLILSPDGVRLAERELASMERRARRPNP